MILVTDIKSMFVGSFMILVFDPL
uniref:Uncharacterized protein n=1 Tax=Rhizophora mucronata TaxID=61149 RepID=A0A2P2N8U6_RHIMU